MRACLWATDCYSLLARECYSLQSWPAWGRAGAGGGGAIWGKEEGGGWQGRVGWVGWRGQRHDARLAPAWLQAQRGRVVRAVGRCSRMLGRPMLLLLACVDRLGPPPR